MLCEWRKGRLMQRLWGRKEWIPATMASVLEGVPPWWALWGPQRDTEPMSHKRCVFPISLTVWNIPKQNKIIGTSGSGQDEVDTFLLIPLSKYSWKPWTLYCETKVKALEGKEKMKLETNILLLKAWYSSEFPGFSFRLLPPSLDHHTFSSVQFSSVARLCPTLCDPMSRSTPGLPVHHQLLESTQTHVHQVGDAIQSSHPLSSPSPPASNPSQHQGLFQWVNSSHEVAKVLEFQLQHQSHSTLGHCIS